MMTKPKPRAELTRPGLWLHRLPSEGDLPLYQRPIFWAVVVAVVFVILNIIFW